MAGVKTVLIVDDEIEICEIIGEYLESRGHEVLTAHSGEKGLALILERRPDVILLDLRLKDISGIDVLTRLQQLSVFSRVIMISGVDDVEKISLTRSLGSEEYLVKPFELEKLDQLVNSE